MVIDERDRKLLASLNAPAPVGARFGVTQYLFGIYSARRDLLDAFPDLDTDGEAFIEWVHAHGRDEVPIIDELLPPKPAKFRHYRPTRKPDRALPRWGVNVVGFMRAELGMGEAARLIISGLDAVGVPLLPVEGAVRPPSRHDHEYETVPPTAAWFPISILCTNPLGVFDLRHEEGREFFTDRFSIGFWWWETHGQLPFEWRADFDLLDEVWVASEFAADCLQPQLPMPVVPMKLPVEVTEVPTLSRAELGLPEGFLFLFVFDYASTLRRKNPSAVIECFRRAFAPGDGASLVIKCINPMHDPEGHTRLKALVAEHPDIRLIEQYVSSLEKNAMIGACDCYVSLHRAEGFGLTAAEAMYLGKPVIATGYSGSLDYMTEHNSHLVSYTMTKVGTGAWPYPRDGVWAEPDLDHATELMRRVYEDREASRALGIRAARDIRRTHSPAAAGEAIKRRLSEIALRPEGRTKRRSRHARPATRAAGLLARDLKERLLAVLADAGLERSARVRPLDRVRELELNLALTQAAELEAARNAARRRVARPHISAPSANGSHSVARVESVGLRLPDIDGKSVLDVDTCDDFMAADLAELGTFDVVICRGLLSRVVDPLEVLRRLGAVTNEMAVIESAACSLPGQEDRVLCEFGRADPRRVDPTNRERPNLIAIHGLLKAAGFADSETVTGPPVGEPAPVAYRAVIHAFKKKRVRGTSSAPVSGAVSVRTDVGELWYPGHCHVITPAVQQQGAWDPQDAAAITAALSPGMTVVDIGAHVGYFTILAAQCVGPTGRVVAVEAAPENFTLLKANVTRMGARHVCVTHAAAWRQRGELDLWLSRTNSGDNRVFEHEGADEVVRIPAVLADDLLEGHAHVDLVLLDAQGSERAVIEGMTSTIARCRPQLQSEFWPAALRSAGDDPIGLLRFYQELGYRASVLGVEQPRNTGAAAVVELAERMPGGICTLILTPLR